MSTLKACFGDAKNNPEDECDERCLGFSPDPSKPGHCTCGHGQHRHPGNLYFAYYTYT